MSWNENEVPVELREQVLALNQNTWPEVSQAEKWPRHDPALNAVSVLLVERGTVLSALDILSKDVVHRGETYCASGISTMVTRHASRGHGLGRTLAVHARQVMAGSGADLALFTCDTPLKSFYEGAGFTELPGTLLIGGTWERPFRSDQFDKTTLGAFFSTKARARHEDFIGAEIELYTGDIDKLW